RTGPKGLSLHTILYGRRSTEDVPGFSRGDPVTPGSPIQTPVVGRSSGVAIVAKPVVRASPILSGRVRSTPPPAGEEADQAELPQPHHDQAARLGDRGRDGEERGSVQARGVGARD